jgi:hypothetical protein
MSMFFVSIGLCQDSKTDNLTNESQLPKWCIDYLNTQFDKGIYKLSDYINPKFLIADFNGDRNDDVAIVISTLDSDKKGILIIHQKVNQHFILGAGINIGNGGDDFKWMDIWKIYNKSELRPGIGETEIISLKSKAILVEKSESASAVIYWTGTEYKWYQQGD